MLEVCLMLLLLSDELISQIIIHSIKDEPVYHFLNLRNKIYDTFWRICDSDEVLLHMSLRDLREACKNRYFRSCFERYFCEANHPEALCFVGMERLMRRWNPDKGLKLIEDAAAEDSVNTENWYRKRTDLWAEFGNKMPFGKKNLPRGFSKDACGRQSTIIRQKDCLHF
jgi:hypothetical protein